MTGRQDLFEESMQLGHSAAWEQDWDRALEFYRKALAEFPEEHDALVSLGLALVETGHEKEALGVYNKASKADPNDPVPAEKCASIFEDLGQFKEAIQSREAAAELYLRRRDVEKAIDNWNHIGRLSPGNLAARTRLALTNERLGRRRQSVHEYLAVAAILQAADKVDRATEAVQRALALVPGDAEATKAMRLLQKGNPLPAPVAPIGSTRPLRMNQVKTFLETPEPASMDTHPLGPPIPKEADVEWADPEEAAEKLALSMLAGLLFEDTDQDGEEEEEPSGLGSLARGISRARGSNATRASMLRYLGQAIDLQSHDKRPQAIKEYSRALDSGLSHPAVHFTLGRLYKETGNSEEAKKHFLEAIGHPELSLGVNLALGRLAKGENDLPEAARYLVQALRIADSMSVSREQSGELGQIYDSMLATQSEGDDQALSEIVDNALDFLSGPEWLKRVREAREQLQGRGDGIEVVPIAQILAGGGSDRVLKALQRVDELARQSKFASAMEEAMLALEYAPSYLALHRRIAQIMIRTGRTEPGLSKLATIAETHRIRGEVAEAADTYTTVLRYSPVDLPSRRKLIDLLIQQDKHQAVLEQYLELSDLYRQLAQIDAARKTLAEALQHVQGDGSDREWGLKILGKMGDIDISRLDWHKGVDVFRQIRVMDPENEEARAKLIDLHLRLGQEKQAADELDDYLKLLVQNKSQADALELLEELAREHPGLQTLHARLAEAYRQAGRTADAIAQFDALGEIQLDSGDVQGAIQSIKTIIEIGPPDVEGYQELLRNLESRE